MGGEWSLHGRVVLVTGATSGLGRVAAFALARLGARIYLVCRDPARAARTVADMVAATGHRDLHVLHADLSTQADVRRVAAEFLATGDPLHVLLNNAGAVFGLRRQLSADGIEMTFALNQLAYFTLTTRLLPRLRDSAPARIVNVASDAYTMAGGRFDFADVNADRRYRPLRQYARSKLANLLFTRELARRLAGTGVTANAASPPGLTATRFAHNVHPLARIALRLAAPFCVPEADGAAPVIHLCSAPAVEGLSGRFFCGMADTALAPAATNDDDARRLWALCEVLAAPADAGGGRR
jgi:NAD(P)-dependent dehydrogenase (short-subunit alcohol dehydrogenase family)